MLQCCMMRPSSYAGVFLKHLKTQHRLNMQQQCLSAILEHAHSIVCKLPPVAVHVNQMRYFRVDASLHSRKKAAASASPIVYRTAPSLSKFTTPTQQPKQSRKPEADFAEDFRTNRKPVLSYQDARAVDIVLRNREYPVKTGNNSIADPVNPLERKGQSVAEREQFLNDVAAERKRFRNDAKTEKRVQRQNTAKGNENTSNPKVLHIDKPSRGGDGKMQVLNIDYISLSPNDLHFTQSLERARNLKQRFDKRRRLLLEGVRLVREAFLAPSVTVRDVFFSEEDVLKQAMDIIEAIQNSQNQIQLYRVTREQMKSLSDMTTPPGLMAIAALPDMEVLQQNRMQSIMKSVRSSELLQMSVICDAVRDPNNMGALIRSCAAAGVQAVYTTRPCCDAMSPKVLRAAMGAQFYLPVHMTDAEDVQQVLQNHVLNRRIPESSPTSSPQKPLDVYVAYSKHTPIEAGDDATGAVPDTHNIMHVQKLRNIKRRQREVVASDSHSDMPVSITYSDVNFAAGMSQQRECALIIGGETGLSPRTLQLLLSSGQQQQTTEGDNSARFRFIPIRIPLQESIDSLNLAHAASVILFEVRRQVDEAAADAGAASEAQFAALR